MKTIRKDFVFNRVYLQRFLPNKKRFAVLMGGAGSGKSMAAAMKIVWRMKSEPGHRFLIIRKVASTIRDSVYRLFCDIINDYGLESEFTILKSEFRIIHKSGNELLFYGLDDSEKIKSIAGISSIWVEEASEITIEDFFQLNLRLRGETQSYKEFILTFNPVSIEHWLKAEFFDKQDDEIFTLVTTYKNNAFLDAQYVQELETRYRSDENLYRIYVEAKWGLVQTGNACYKQFNIARNVKRLEYDPSLPLLLSCDFNVNPYSAFLIAQLSGKTLKILDEICLKHPHNSLRDNCLVFKKRYGSHRAGLSIYGDASGRAQDKKEEKGFNDFVFVQSELKEFKPSLRVPSINPPVVPRIRWINNVFANLRPVTIEVDERCKNLIDDLSFVVEDETGGKQKNMYKDKVSGVSYQRWGHCSDSMDYLLCYVFANDFDGYKRGGKPMNITVGKNIRNNTY